MKFTKTAAVALAGTIAMAATAQAGGMAEPMMEPEVIVEEASASSGGFVLPLILLAIIAAIASSDGGGIGPS